MNLFYMSTYKVKIAKIVMNLLPAKPIYDISFPRSETINHKDFINASEIEKEKILFNMARRHYLDDQNKPFNLYFPKYPFEKFFSKSKILDLGCFCGGSTVSFAEKWNVKYMYGIDVNEYFIMAARLFSASRQNKNINYDFTIGFGEELPYEDNTFDAIVSRDTFEHVKSVKDTLVECKRILKPGGKLFSVFPSYYFPFDGAHMLFVTRMPFIQWFFAPETLNLAYNEIIKSRGDEAYWYKSNEKVENNWQKLHGGIGVNGTTFHEFKSMVKQIGFSKVEFLQIPLLYVSNLSVSHPEVKNISKLLKPLLKIESLQDYLSHRIASILIK